MTESPRESAKDAFIVVGIPDLEDGASIQAREEIKNGSCLKFENHQNQFFNFARRFNGN